MRCPYCHGDDTQVMDTRVSDEGDAIRRRRRCTACDKRFTTHERAELTLPSIVKKMVVALNTVTTSWQAPFAWLCEKDPCPPIQ